MRRQQLQNSHVLPHSGASTMSLFQTLTQLQKYSRKFPLAVHVRMIKSRRTPLQSRQIMQWIKHLITGLIASLMRGHDRVLVDDFHTIDVRLHRH